MQEQDINNIINEYFNGNTSLPFFVAVDDNEEYLQIKDSFINLKYCSDFCKNDTHPDIDELKSWMKSADKNSVLTGLGDYLKLEGMDKADKILSELKDVSLSNGKIVILCHKLRSFIEKMENSNPRIKGRQTYVSTSKNNVDTREIIIVPKDFPCNAYDGFKQSLEQLEDGENEKIFVKTALKFPNSLIKINEIKSYYDRIKNILPKFNISEDCGTNEQWGSLLKDIYENNNSLEILFNKYNFGNTSEQVFNDFINGEEYKNWLYFIALKSEQINNEYLRHVVNKTNNFNVFKGNILSSLLGFNVQDKNFQIMYNDRKKLIKNFSEAELALFCEQSKIKAQDRIYYLTDSTLIERQAIIESFAVGGLRVDILENLYPDLYHYLDKFMFDCGDLSEILSGYFQEYNTQKLFNTIEPAFLKKVKDNASKREYNLLPTRSEIFDKLDKSNTDLYYIDALGVEFLSFIQYKCAQMGLNVNIKIARANLPSITSLNKDFYENWNGAKITIKKLDELKHKDEGGFDYKNSKLPIHLAKELEIIVEIMERARTELSSQQYKKIIISSDHGASRLAVINEQELQYEVDSKGTYSGRCCAFCELEYLEDAAEENDWLVLASYGRFKGGRAASVEVHGGASFEEVLVPIIELTLSDNKIDIQIENPNITASFRKNAEIVLFSIHNLNNIFVMVNNRKYTAEKIDNNRHQVIFADIKQAGTYTARIYYGDNLINETEFIVTKEGMQENDLF